MVTVVDLFKLKELRIWTSSIDKVPHAPELGYNAKSDAPETWTDYKTAEHWSKTHQKDSIFTYGVNVALKGVPNLCVIDIDKVLNFETGELIENPLAAEILEPFREVGAYIERSISFLGWHIYFYVDYEKLHILNKSEFDEKYSASDSTLHIDFRSGLYAPYFMGFTETDASGAFKECSEQCLAFLDKYMKRTVNGSPRTFSYSPGVLGESWRDRLEMARKSKNGDKFKALYDNGGMLDGVMLNGGDKSSNDYALCCLLAFWLNRDPEAMKEAFLASSLGKRFTDPEKTDKKKSRGYVERTIEKAISQQKEVYTPRRGRPKKQEQDTPQRVKRAELPNGKIEKEVLTIDKLDEFLTDSGVEVGRNSISKNTELLSKNTLNPETIGKDLYAYIHSIVSGSERFKGISFSVLKSYVDTVANAHQFNPIDRIIDQYGGWDGEERIEKTFKKLSPIPDDGLSYTLFKKWLFGCYAITLNGIGKNAAFGQDGILVLYGGQGEGKTLFATRLCPRAEWFNGSNTFSELSGREAKVTISNSFITEIGELAATLNEQSSDPFKNVITAPGFNQRTLYTNNTEITVKRGSIIATCDKKGFLVDKAGNRRYFTIPIGNVSRGAIEEIDERYSVMLWAEVREQFSKFKRSELATNHEFQSLFRLTSDEKKRLNIRNADFMDLSPCEETIRDIFNDCNYKNLPRTDLTSTEFREAHKLFEFTQREVAVALKAISAELSIPFKPSTLPNMSKSKRYINVPAGIRYNSVSAAMASKQTTK